MQGTFTDVDAMAWYQHGDSHSTANGNSNTPGLVSSSESAYAKQSSYVDYAKDGSGKVRALSNTDFRASSRSPAARFVSLLKRNGPLRRSMRLRSRRARLAFALFVLLSTLLVARKLFNYFFDVIVPMLNNDGEQQTQPSI